MVTFELFREKGKNMAAAKGKEMNITISMRLII